MAIDNRPHENEELEAQEDAPQQPDAALAVVNQQREERDQVLTESTYAVSDALGGGDCQSECAVSNPGKY